MSSGPVRTGRGMELLEAAQELRRAGRLAEARARFGAALAVSAPDGDDTAYIEAALGLGGLWVQERRETVDRAALITGLERARARASAGSLLEARIRVRLAAEAVYDGGPVGAVADAVGTVRAHGDDHALAEALSMLHNVELAPWHAQSRLTVAEELIRLAIGAGDPLLTLMGLCWRTVDLFLLGDHRAGQSLHELRERAAEDECEAIAYIGDVLHAMVEARAGNLGRAEELAAQARDRGLSAGDPDAPAYFGAMLAALRHWQGRDDEVIDLVRATSTLPHLGANAHVYVAAGAALSAATGDLDGAEEALAQLTGIGLDRLPESSSWLTTQALLAEAAFRLGDAGVAGDVSRLTMPYAELPVMPSLAVVCLGSGRRIMGLTAAVLGDFDTAVEQHQAALAANLRLGNRPLTAITEHELAWLLRVRGLSDDASRAVLLSRRAGQRADRVGVALAEPPGWLIERMPASDRTSGRPPGPPERQASIVQTEYGWRVVIDGRATVLGHLIGLSYLAILVDTPGADHDVLELAAGFARQPTITSDALLDAAALRDYRTRALEVSRALTEPNLPVATEQRLRRELQAIAVAVRGGTALRGRARFFPTNHERARTAVRKALIRATAAISAFEPELAAVLRDGLTTGAACRFEPRAGWSIRSSRMVSV